MEIKDTIEKITEINFDCVLLKLYRDGKDSVAWHSDNLPADGKHHHIAEHQVPKTTRATGPRINLTFRISESSKPIYLLSK